MVIGFLLWRPYLATVRRFASFFQLGVMVQEYQGDPIHVTADKPIMISQGSDITDTMPDRGEGAGRIGERCGVPGGP